MSVSQWQQLERTWENQIEKGNRLFQDSAFDSAYPYYMDAMMVSEILIEDLANAPQQSSHVPGMYYTACINIAHNYWGMQDLKNAETTFLIAHIN